MWILEFDGYLIHKAIIQGRVIISYIPYGFVKKPDGIFIEPQQAKVFQQIYQRYPAGDSLKGIADFLFQDGVPRQNCFCISSRKIDATGEKT